MDQLELIRRVDQEAARALERERRRQQQHLELIASENYASLAVRAAQGSIFTNKYAEGYPGRRYYGGCENMDLAEDLARQRVERLFNAEYSNVQPHAGAQANMAVYFAALEPGDKIMGLGLPQGGHLTHGSAVNFSGRWYQVIPYGLDRETELIDYQELRSLALAHRPRLIVAGASAYPRTLDFEAFRQVADEVGALLMVDMAHIAGLVAAGVHPNPVPVADFVTSTTHKTLRGPRGGFVLCRRQYAQAVDKAVFPGLQGGPLMHAILAKAVAFKEAASEGFRIYQRQVVANAVALAEALKGYRWRLVTGGTDNHLILVDLRDKGITGREAEELLDQVGITVNKNAIPFDPAPPAITSGLRLGTPAVTTRGLGQSEMERLARAMELTLTSGGRSRPLAEAKAIVRDLCTSFPLEMDDF